MVSPHSDAGDDLVLMSRQCDVHSVKRELQYLSLWSVLLSFFEIEISHDQRNSGSSNIVSISQPSATSQKSIVLPVAWDM